MLWFALLFVGVSPRWLSDSLREWFFYITEVWEPASQVAGHSVASKAISSWLFPL